MGLKAVASQPEVGLGTVTSVSVSTANGVSGSVANPTTTPAITLTLAAITPTTIAGTDATDSTSSITGAFKTAGGLGVAKAIFAGTTIQGTTITATTGFITGASGAGSLTVGTSNGANAGFVINNAAGVPSGASGYGYLHSTSVTPSNANYVLASNGTGTELHGIGAVFIETGVNADIKITQVATAGAGPAITAGTAASAVSAETITQTRNFSGSATNYRLETYVETATHASDNYWRVLAGSAGTSPVLTLGLGGNLSLGTSAITAAQGTSALSIKHATTTLSAVNGATVTATNLIPAKANVLGVNTVVLTTCTTATGYTVGDGSDADRWGVAATVSAGTDTDGNDATANPTGWFTAANNVVITATGGSFDGTGAIFVDVMYTLSEAT